MTDDNILTKRIRLIGASAGTGKTTRLAGEYVDYVSNGVKTGARATEIIATTFTTKAADELVERVRQQLISGNQWDAAQEIFAAYVGTIHSICKRMLDHYALEMGLPPELEIITEERKRTIFAASIDPAISQFMRDMEDAAGRLSWETWREDVLSACQSARENVMGPETLQAFAKRSLESMLKILPPAHPALTAKSIDEALARAVSAALKNIKSQDDGSETVAKAIAALENANRTLQTSSDLKWANWVSLSKIKATRQLNSLLDPVRSAAAVHGQHPRLRADIETVITGFFKSTQTAMELYDQFKRSQGLLDFTDLEFLALKLLDSDEVLADLKNRISLTLVDEFQDTSPIQLSFFLKLAQVTGRSIWVGDEKQAIYGFRGTDPELITSIVHRVPSTNRDQLVRSYRSRPALVNFVNEVFTSSFPRLGTAADQVRISQVERSEGNGQDDCLQVWWLSEKDSFDKAIPALAQGVSMLLKGDKPLLVCDRKTNQLRAAIGSDIVILCRSNDRCGQVAEALSKIKLSVATERDNLLNTPECALAFSCLRYLTDSHDTLASAEIAHILEGGDGNGKWFVDWLTDGCAAVEEAKPQFAALRQAASGLINLTPTEVLETAIFTGGVVEVVKRFGNVRQRMANLDALRGLALQYEELCRVEKRACTPGGLVSFLSTEVENGGKQPPDPDKNAVRVATYHSAKGLEWPIVIMFDLQEPRVPNAFGVSVEPRDQGIDPMFPLKDRWIRFWPWPYGNHKKDVGLDTAMANSPEMQRVVCASEAENTRLLYVGMTRARDYLIFAAKNTKPAAVEWLTSLRNTDNSQVLSLPQVPGKQNIQVGNAKFPCKVLSLDSRNVKPQGSIAGSSISSYTSKKLLYPLAHRLPYRLIPSAHSSDKIEPKPDTASDTSKKTPIISIGARLPLAGSPDMRDVGDALHRFLAVDNIAYPDDERLECATAMLKRWNVTALNPDSLVLASTRLNSFITDQFGACKRLAECPITGRIGNQRVSGRLDLLIETDAGYIIIDHKSFPGKFDEWVARAQSHKPQLDVYKQVVEQATSRPVLQILIHMPIVASIISLV